MSDNSPAICATSLALPESAPRIRITAGPGSAAQKTWNLRRPVTLIGSRRPAHIVLHDRDISQAHCVIINTGREVVLKDLHTTSGTLVRKDKVDLTLLSDGDVITVGDTTIQIAIQPGEPSADDSGCGQAYDDPLLFGTPIRMGLLHADCQWHLRECVALVGRHNRAAVHLDHDGVASRHAIIFRFHTGPALFDLGGGESVLLNGQHCSLAPLVDGDRISIGSFGLQIRIEGTDGTRPDPLAEAIVPNLPDATVETNGRSDATVTANGKHPARPATSESEGEDMPVIDALQRDITEAWDQLNSWSEKPSEPTVCGATGSDAANGLSERAEVLAQREGELDVRDAKLRGQLHDAARISEGFDSRDSAIEAREAEQEAERRRLVTLEQACGQRESDLARRFEELARREHVFAQRWTRMRTAKCPHCGKPISNAGTPTGGEPASS